ncbi:hypothetical protein M9Y10_029672 [Tritrichomonas musculus]|uniref:Endoplasmic reticulum-Golgi intermediate compartment protein 3 n=1 Tax=Tritrichomonas musculus TaxID=1915356 RepID=A0ABR2KMY6_9EUKA
MKQFLSSIDVYDKFSADEYRVRTVYGAILSFFLSMFGSILFFAQFVEFAIPDISRELMINRNLTSNMDRVNISISILINQPCHFLTIGNLDSLGINKFYNSTVRFIRYTKSGFYKGLADPLPNLNLNMSGKWKKEMKQNNPNYQQNISRCLPCYGIRKPGECCNTCEELYLLHIMKKKEPHPEEWEQCTGVDPKYLKDDISLDEQCKIKGKLTVNKVPGNFNIIYGSRSIYNTYGSGIFMRSTISDEYPFIDLSHSIERLRFGPGFPMMARPLDDRQIIIQKKQNLSSYKYDLVCTLVFLIRDGQILARTFEYNELTTNFPVTPENKLVPGIFFYYQFTPYAVVVNLRSKPISRFIGMTFGVLAGGFAITTLLDNFLYSIAGAKKQTPIAEDE